MRAWLAVFALTQAVELVVAGALLRRAEPRRARRLGLVLLATALTHPIVWFALPRLPLSYPAYAWTAELFAWLAETAIYSAGIRRLGWERALLVSLAANAASAGATFAARALGAPL